MSTESDFNSGKDDGQDCARPRRLGEILVSRGIITTDQLDQAITLQRTTKPRKPLGKLLIELNYAKSHEITEALAESLSIPFATLTPEMVRQDAVAVLDTAFQHRHNFLPLSSSEGWLTIAIENFTDIVLIEEIQRLTGLRVQTIAADADNIRAIRELVQQLAGRMKQLSQSQGESDLDTILGASDSNSFEIIDQQPSETDADLMATSVDSPVVKLVNHVIHRAIELQASDIHIEPDLKSFRIRYRVDGELINAMHPSQRYLSAVVSRVKIMAGMDISERRLPQDGVISITLTGRHIDLRVSTMATRFGEKVVMRLVDRDSGARLLDHLGFAPRMLTQFRSICQVAYGLVLVTGPTGSGKTTTLYAALSDLVTSKHNISTVEDPVERYLPGTNQFPTHSQAGFTFAHALRSLLRQDPDVIMVGEIRDPETAKLATEAALTGHLVLSSLHTNDAPTAIPRLINMGLEPYMVSAALRGVLAQRLAKKICQQCKQPHTLSPRDHEAVTRINPEHRSVTASFVGEGCSTCGNLGTSGRIGIFELLVTDEDLNSLVARDLTIESVRQQMVQRGMTTLIQDGFAKVEAGLIPVRELLGIASLCEDTVDPALKLAS
ncbi:MAG TPA: ATPase, T2SS/T4P/T4SS family [Phycisphaerales bacterium]|nr:ATPase, T2SS/T4P/T4SS family [Phycisphaerales bacterium]